MGNYSEPFCSSSEKRYSKMDQHDNPDSVNGKPVRGTEATQNLLGGASHCEGNNVDTEPEICKQDDVQVTFCQPEESDMLDETNIKASVRYIFMF